MSKTLVIKNSMVPGKVPTNSDLQWGELALNIPDKIIYSMDDQGTVVPLTKSPDNFVQPTDYATSTKGGTVKMRLDGTTLYITNDGTDA